jgi:hypothetical protein
LFVILAYISEYQKKNQVFWTHLMDGNLGRNDQVKDKLLAEAFCNIRDGCHLGRWGKR